MRFFVTGATGFIGRHLCQALVSRGHEVVAMVRSAAKLGVLPKRIELFQGDLGCFADRATVLPVADIVIHLAGVVAADELEEYEAVNYRAVEQLLACLGRQSWTPRRLLFASSLAAAGPSPANQPWTERETLHPIDPYGSAKARAEVVVAKAPFPTTSFRPPMVFGPEDPATLTVGKRVRVLPRAALYAIMRVSTLGSGWFGYTNQLDRKQYQQMVAPAFVCSSDAIRRELAWSPRHDLSAALTHAAEGYRAAGLL